MGTVFEYQGQYGAAVNAKEEAVKAFEGPEGSQLLDGRDPERDRNALSLLGRAEEARKPLAEALKLAGEIQNKALTAQVQNFEGDRLFYSGDARTAQSQYEQALATAAKTADKRLELLSRVNLAKVAIEGDGRSRRSTR